MFLIETVPDSRDYLYEDCITGNAAENNLPVRYRSNYTRIEDQGYSNHCVSHAFTSGMEIKQMMIAGAASVPELSRLFLQSECKKIDGYPNDEGTTMRSALKVLQKLGVCEEALYPWLYNEAVKKNIFPDKSETIYENAAKYRIANYASVSKDIMSLKRAIYNESCIFLSNRCFGNYTRSFKGHTLPPSGRYQGNHATVLIGWDDEYTCSYNGRTYTGFFIRLNSYGDKFYAHGEEYIPYEAFTSWQVNGSPWFAEAWTAISKAQLTNPDYHKLLSKDQVIAPLYTEIKLTIGKRAAVIDGVSRKISVAPQIRNGTTFVPLRFLTDSIQTAKCFWDAAAKQVVLIDLARNRRYLFTIGHTDVIDQKGNIVYKLPAPPFTDSGRTYLPIRAYCELLGAKVDYFPSTKQLTIRI